MAVFPVVNFEGRRAEVSSGFGPRKKPGGGTAQHRGADITFRAREGDPPYAGRYTADRSPNYYSPAGVFVVSTEPGVVVQSADKKGIGGDVWVHHPASGNVTRYAHLSARVVKVGDQVGAGQLLGTWGAGHGTPLRHLHFELLRAGALNSQRDPRSYLASADHLDAPTRARTSPPLRGPVATLTTRPGFGGTPWLLLLLLGLASTRS